MKRKISIFLMLIISIVTLFSMGAVGVMAENSTPTFRVSAKDYTITVGSKLNFSYSLKIGDYEIATVPNQIGEDTYYTSPYIVILDGETEVFKGVAAPSGVEIDTSKFATGEKELVLKVYDNQSKSKMFDDTTFNLVVKKKDNTMTIVMIVLIVVIVGYLIWSSISNKKKQKKAQSQVSALKVGDRVKTIGGVCGFVKEINNDENTFILEVGENSFVKFDKGAIYQTAPAEGTIAAEKKETK